MKDMQRMETARPLKLHLEELMNTDPGSEVRSADSQVAKVFLFESFRFKTGRNKDNILLTLQLTYV